MKKLIVLSLVVVATAAVATNQGADKFIETKLDEWFAEAKPVSSAAPTCESCRRIVLLKT